MKNGFHVSIRIRKPIAEVFDAVVNPEKLSGYFTQTASGPLREGETVTWTFADFPGEAPVTVKKVAPNSMIQFEWESMEGGYNTLVEMRFKQIDSNTTLVTIEETGWRETEKGKQSSYLNCSGWMHMLCCLKAYLEYGINLRTGSFHPDDLVF
jgi:uncharacterized protein YndB with AHSA1/START domain